MTWIHYDQSTWLAKIAMDAVALGPPAPPAHVVLQGALAAVPADRLAAYQEAGLAEHEIVRRVNARWETEHGDRLAEHEAWVARYTAELEERHQRATREAAKRLRRQAVFDAFMEGLDKDTAEGEGT